MMGGSGCNKEKTDQTSPSCSRGKPKGCRFSGLTVAKAKTCYEVASSGEGGGIC